MFKISIVCVLATLTLIIEITETKLQHNQEEFYHHRNISKSLNLIILNEFANSDNIYARSPTFSIFAKFHPSRKRFYYDIMNTMLSGLPSISVTMASNHRVGANENCNYLILVDSLQSLRCVYCLTLFVSQHLKVCYFAGVFTRNCWSIT